MTETLQGPAVGALCDAIQDASARVALTLRGVTDPGRPAVGTWDIGEVANHVASAPGYWLAAAQGRADVVRLDDVDAANAQALTGDVERDPRMLADRLELGVRDLVAYGRTVEGDPVVRPFAGIEAPLSSLLAVVLGELLVHGYDVARAAGLPWHIDPAAAVLTLEGYLPLLPYAVDRAKASSLHLRLEISIRGAPTHVVVIDRGTLHVDPPSAVPADARLSADPVTYLLLTFNRIRPWRPLLRGRIRVHGRRPWLIRKFQSLVKA